MVVKSIQCISCQHTFKAEEAEIYECPKCGTSIRAQGGQEEFDKTQIFRVR